MGVKFAGLTQTNAGQQKDLKGQLSTVQEKIDNLEESYFVLKQMSEETFRKFMSKYSEEKATILEAMQDFGKDCSNLPDYYIAAR